MSPIQIDVYHDTACPWCRIGKAHMKQALAQWDGPVTVEYHTFFLNPNIPPEGYAFHQYMDAKGGGQVPMEGWFARPRKMGEQSGILFNFEQIEFAPNTLLSHQLIALAPSDKQETVIDAVYAAYFEHGRNIGDIDVLIDIAEAHGFDSASIRSNLEDTTKHNAILAGYQTATQLGVTGVPFFVFNKRLAFSGAQPPEAFLQVLEQITQEQIA